MHRPTRKHRHLKEKLERKSAISRKVGAKAKRWKKWIKEYESLVKGKGKKDEKPAQNQPK